MPYYVVWLGNKNGIYDNWTACEKQIKGFKGAIYKKFLTFHEAHQAFSQHPKDFVRLDTSYYTADVHKKNQRTLKTIVPKQVKEIKKQKKSKIKTINQQNKQKEQLVGVEKLQKQMIRNIGVFIENAICVDASCIIDEMISNSFGKVEYRGVWLANKDELFHSKIFPKGTINIVEFLAIVDALKYIKRYSIHNSIIFSDSLTAIQWVANKKCNTKLERNHETEDLFELVDDALSFLKEESSLCPILKWQTEIWGDIPADFRRKTS